MIPVGLIDTTWGGTPAHSWISPEGLAAANLSSVFEDAGTIARTREERTRSRRTTLAKMPLCRRRVSHLLLIPA